MNEADILGKHRIPRLLAPSRDTHTNWNTKDPIIPEGVLGFTKDRIFNGNLEYFLGDGIHKYSELTKYGGAEASILSKAYTLVLRDSNGKIDPSSIDFPIVPDATPTVKGIVKASTTKAGNNVVKADANGGLDGWKDAIIDAIIANDGSGGLGTDANGDMIVDFDQMPTDKFEALLKSLKMQIPLEANLDVYVNQNSAAAADTIEDGRGTQAKPFLHIKNCVNFVTSNYSLGKYNITIHVASGTYSENITLPTYTRTSGIIKIIADDYNNPPTITNQSVNGNVITCSGGIWQLIRFNIVGNFKDSGTPFSFFISTIAVNGGSTELSIYGCNISAEYTDNAPVGSYNMRCINVGTGSTISFFALEGYPTTLSCIQGNATNAVFLRAERQGRIALRSANYDEDNITYNISCSGTATTFLELTARSLFDSVGGGAHQFKFVDNGVTAIKYKLYGNSGCSSPSGGFPGTANTGSVESTTYCYIV